MDKKTSQFGTITAVQAESAGTEGYIPYVDPSQTDPDLRNKRMTRSEAKKFFGMQVLTTLSGTSWDGGNKTLTLTSNTALTFSSTKRVGLLRVKQDGTGSRTLSINGVSVPVASGANTITVVSFFYDDVAGTYIFNYDTNILGNVGGGLTQLSSPGSFTATPVSSSEIDLSWTDVANETGYDIYFNGINDLGSAGLLVSKAANSTSHAHTGLGASSLLYYWIIAKGDGVTYSNSNPASTSGTSLSGGGGGTFTAASRVAFYKNSSMVRSGGAIDSWTNADGNAAYDFNDYPLNINPVDATTQGMQFTGVGEALKTASRIELNTPLTIYMLVKKTGDGAFLSNTTNGNGYGIALTAGSGVFIAPDPDTPTYYSTTGTGVADMSAFKILCFTWTGPGSPFKMYIDGVLTGTFTENNTTSYTKFGIDYLSGYGGNSANGYLNGLAFFNVEHDASTVATQSPLFKTAAEA
jgi:hypothetical protein